MLELYRLGLDACRQCCWEDAGASWADHRLPEGVHDVYAVACI
jgi:hypothetical protein